MAQIKFEKLTSNPVDNPTNKDRVVVTEIGNRYKLFVADNTGVHKKVADSWYNEITPNVSFIEPIDGDRVYMFRANKGNATLKSVSYAIRGTGSCQIEIFSVINPGGTSVSLKALTDGNNKDEIDTSITISSILQDHLVYVRITDISGSVSEVYVELAIEYN